MSKTIRLTDLQNLFYIWMSKFEKRSLENIKLHCDFLNESYGLNLPYPNWSIFWPLVFNGLIDHIGKGYYALTTPIIIDFGYHYVYINYKPNNVKSKLLTTGIYLSERIDNPRDFAVIKVNPLSALKRFPTVKDVVDSFDKSQRDTKELEYYHWKSGKGIAKLEADGLTRYFSIPDELYLRELPSRSVNPEAFAIAYSFSRAINNIPNGSYNKTTNTLTLPTFALPYILYRTLLLHALSEGAIPEVSDKYYIFNNVPSSYVRQLNRIFLNSIVYE